MSALKQVLIGRPLARYQEAEQRLPKRIALAVFASDAISSTAHATEEILRSLEPVAGMVARRLLFRENMVVTSVPTHLLSDATSVPDAYEEGLACRP